MNIRIFTHTDLDGLNSAILLGLAYENPYITYCSYNNINEEVLKFLNDDIKRERFDHVFITDISVNEDVAELINTNYGHFVTILDHHKTAEWLNKYDWARVDDVNSEDRTTCGASMVYEYLSDINPYFTTIPNIKEFVEWTRLYDTWEWYDDKINGANAKALNDLVYIYGFSAYYKIMLEALQTHQPIFNELRHEIVRLKQKEIEIYIDRKEKQVKRYDILGYKVGVVYAENHVSELGNELVRRFMELDFIAIINMGQGTVSYRCIREDVDLSAVASHFGGGGHRKASGSSVPTNLVEELTKGIFKLD